ncbi:uncharacterized protein LOC125828990 [Solanum verrucosum]|uniref:uncharacterized protein LOC125828990 n=1 Tax=Solanum verrucosum TaxID=315347 RepID=UPI0020D1BE94|nr:uncharacterized protein LOC125828990 [Solanum verrucosum]
MDIARLMIHVQQVEEDKLKNREEFRSKRAKTKIMSRLVEDRKYKLIILSAKVTKAFSIVNYLAQRFTRNPLCCKCSKLHSGEHRVGIDGFFKCGRTSHFSREFLKNKQCNGGNKAQSSSAAPEDRNSQRGAAPGIGGGTNLLYAIASR